MTRSWRRDRRDRWATAVRQSLHLTPGQKVINLETVRHMAADGKFSVERTILAAALRLSHPNRVSEAWTAARQAELAVLVSKMAYGQPTRYQATFPSSTCSEACTLRKHVPLKVSPACSERTHPVTTGGATPERSLLEGSTELSPPVVNGEAVHLSKTPTNSAHSRTSGDSRQLPNGEKRSDDETEGRPVVADLEDCHWHGPDFMPCPLDCANHETNREKSA